MINKIDKFIDLIIEFEKMVNCATDKVDEQILQDMFVQYVSYQIVYLFPKEEK